MGSAKVRSFPYLKQNSILTINESKYYVYVTHHLDTKQSKEFIDLA